MTVALMDRIRGVTRAQADVDALLELLREGAQDRTVLAMRLHVTDRRMRHSIDHARRRGELVIWADGYYRIAESREQFEAWKRAEMKSRLGTLHEQLRRMDQAADRIWPVEQMRWIT